MKKCVLFFIGLLFSLMVSVFTDGERSEVEEDNLSTTTDKVEEVKILAENIGPLQEGLKP